MPRPLREPDPDLIDHTLRVFQQRTSRTLTREDGREIVHNLTGFFRVLMEWDEKERVRVAAAGGDDE